MRLARKTFAALLFLLCLPKTQADGWGTTSSGESVWITTTATSDDAWLAEIRREKAAAAKEAARKEQAADNRQTMLQSLQKGNPTLTQEELTTASEVDVRKFYYNQFRAEGMSMSQAREKASSTIIPMRR
jgi:hypothetical protein